MIFKLGNSIKKADYHKTKLACYMGFITQKYVVENKRSDDHVKLSENKKSLLYGIYHTGYCGKLHTAPFFEISQ